MVIQRFVLVRHNCLITVPGVESLPMGGIREDRFHTRAIWPVDPKIFKFTVFTEIHQMRAQADDIERLRRFGVHLRSCR